MNTRNIGWTDVASLDEKMRMASVVQDLPVLPVDYCSRRDADRSRHDYSVNVDENLLVVHSGKASFIHEDDIDSGIVIPLPFIRGVSPIYKCYTKGRGSSVNLLAFNVTLAGCGEKIQIQQGEPYQWYGDDSMQGWKDRAALLEDEKTWHKQQLAIQRHNILNAINMYINRVREMEPLDRQLKLGF